MSKKQSTLFQSWTNSSNKGSSSHPATGDIIDLSDEDDGDDLLLAMAMEESLRSVETEAKKSPSLAAEGSKALPPSKPATSCLFKTYNANQRSASDVKSNMKVPHSSNQGEQSYCNAPIVTNQVISPSSHDNQFPTNCDTLLPNNETNALNLSIGHDDVIPSSACVDTTQIEDLPGFDKHSGKLWIYPTNLPVRDYQYNIVQQAIFKNTLVTLPTGLGKTFIAAVVMYNFYCWYPQGKIVFMAPTKPLVAQQIEACYNIMGIPQRDTAEMTGTMAPDKRAVAWQQKRVFFLTPQVLVNDLTRGLCPADYVKCVVVDEAHKALGNHAYCQVISELVKYSRDFRVLALSATPGSDIKSVQKVLDNLLISHIELRTEDCLDIKRYVHERKVEKIVIKLDNDLKQIKAKYVQILEHIVQRLSRFHVLPSRGVESLSKFQILQARNQFRQNPPHNLQRFQMGAIEGDFALCMSLYHGFELLQLHGLRSLYNYLDSLVNGDKGFGRTRSELVRNDTFNDIMNFLLDKYGKKVQRDISHSQAQKNYTFSHPKLQKLLEVVLGHFAQFEKEGEQTRIMVFSQYRESVNEITEMLSMHQPMVKVMSFVGQSTTGKSSKGFTQKEQLQVMKQFRMGGYNTLVATCVGEEGLDIGDVDLIVCFDASKSPIRLVQRMGRTGRKRAGRIVMLVTEGKEEQLYNQSQYSKKSIHKAIMNGAKSLQFYKQNPRMVPLGLAPQSHKMYITVKSKFQAATKTRKGEEGVVPLEGVAARKTKSAPSDGFLTEEELLYWDEHFKVDERDVKVLPVTRLLSLMSSKQENQLSTNSQGPRTLSLADWTPWQNRLQPAHFTGHSMRSRHLVELMEFMELQDTIGDAEDHYGMEMAMYLNKDDVACNNSTILKYCSKELTTTTDKERISHTNEISSKENRNSSVLPAARDEDDQRQKKRFVARRSDMLPVISDDENEWDCDDLPESDRCKVREDTGDMNENYAVDNNSESEVTRRINDLIEVCDVDTGACKARSKTKESLKTSMKTDSVAQSKVQLDRGPSTSNSVLSKNSKVPLTIKSNPGKDTFSRLFPVVQKQISKSPRTAASRDLALNIVVSSDDDGVGDVSPQNSPVFEKRVETFVDYVIRCAPSADDFSDLDKLDSIFSDSNPKLDSNDLLTLICDWKREVCMREMLCRVKRTEQVKIDDSDVRGSCEASSVGQKAKLKVWASASKTRPDISDEDDKLDFCCPPSPVFEKFTQDGHASPQQVLLSPVFEKTSQDCSTKVVPIALDNKFEERKERDNYRDEFESEVPQDDRVKNIAIPREHHKQPEVGICSDSLMVKTSTPVGKKRISLCNPSVSPFIPAAPENWIKTPIPLHPLQKSIEDSVSNKTLPCQETHKPSVINGGEPDFLLSLNMSDFDKTSFSTQIGFSQALAMLHQSPDDMDDRRNVSASVRELKRSVLSDDNAHGSSRNVNNTVSALEKKMAEKDTERDSVTHNDSLCKVDAKNKNRINASKNSIQSIPSVEVEEPKFDLGFDIDFDDDDFEDDIIPPSPCRETLNKITETKPWACDEESQVFHAAKPISVIPDSEAFPVTFTHSDNLIESEKLPETVTSGNSLRNVVLPMVRSEQFTERERQCDKVANKPRLSLKRKSLSFTIEEELSSEGVVEQFVPSKRQDNKSVPVLEVAPFLESDDEDIGVGLKKKKTAAIIESPTLEAGVSPVLRMRKVNCGLSESFMSASDTPVRPKRKKLRKVAFSSDESTNDESFQKQKTVWNLLSTADDGDEDDFDTSNARGNNLSKVRQSWRREMDGNKPRKLVAREFVEVEAELSGEDLSGDESDSSGEDRYEASFINDCTQQKSRVNGDSPDMKAVYLKSVKSPLVGKYKLQYDRRPGLDVFSQASCEDEEDDEYLEDSFCVENEEEETGFMDDTDLDGTRVLLQDHFDHEKSGEKRPKKRRRIVMMESSPEDNELEHVKELTGVEQLNSLTSFSNDASVKYQGQTSCSVPSSNSTMGKCQLNTDSRRSLIDYECKSQLNVKPHVSSVTNAFRLQSQSSADVERKERLKRQKDKQEEFRRMMAEKSRLDAEKSRNDSVASQTHTRFSTVERTGTGLGGPSCVDVISPMSNRVQDKGKLVIFVDSREINGSQNLVSSLRMSHNIHVIVCQLTGCDYIVSHRMGVERKLLSDFSNGANRTKLAEGLRLLADMFERTCLIIEKDRVKSDSKVSTPGTRTKYVDMTLSQLTNTNIKVLFSDSQEETASLLANLAELESRKNMAVNSHRVLTPSEEQALKFYLTLPKVTYVTAMNLVNNFKSVKDFLQSSETDIVKKAVVSLNSARLLYSQIRRRFNPQMLP